MGGDPKAIWHRLQCLRHIFAVLAVVISCLGPIGLAACAAERRAKEIGIVKGPGAPPVLRSVPLETVVHHGFVGSNDGQN